MPRTKLIAVSTWKCCLIIVLFHYSCVIAQNGIHEGKSLYTSACSSCHGKNGDGQGPIASSLEPKPRDFTKGVYKLRTTPSGIFPIDEDLVRTITEGLGHTAMPGWSSLDKSDALKLVSYLKDFYRKSLEEELKQKVAQGELEAEEVAEIMEARLTPGEPIDIPVPPPFSAKSLENGKILFQKLECWKCHGQLGKGDGPSAANLKDEWGQKIRVADFTRPDGMMRGENVVDIYTSFMTGLNGTPMPSYANVVSPGEVWDLAYYVFWLRRGSP